MQRYHLTASGDPAICRAHTRACPLGGVEDHLDAVSMDQARVWAEACLEAQYGVFEDDAIEALDQYQSGSYRNINAQLRGQQTWPKRMFSTTLTQAVARLDMLFTQYEEVSPPRVYRLAQTGARNGFMTRPMVPGEIILEPAYLSTSDDEHFDGRFLDKGEQLANTRFIIDVPETVPCVRPAAHTERYEDETEALFPRGLRFEVIEDWQDDGHRHVHLRMLAPEEAGDVQTSFTADEVERRVPGAVLEEGRYELRSLPINEIIDGVEVEHGEYGQADVESIHVLANRYRAGAALHPLVLETNFLGGLDLLDGNHRVNGAQQAGLTHLECFVKVDED